MEDSRIIKVKTKVLSSRYLEISLLFLVNEDIETKLWRGRLK